MIRSLQSMMRDKIMYPFTPLPRGCDFPAGLQLEIFVMYVTRYTCASVSGFYGGVLGRSNTECSY